MGKSPHSLNPEATSTSSIPHPLPLAQEALFHDVLTLLQQSGRSHAVAGAFAFREHTGICRCTNDLDMFLSPSPGGSASTARTSLTSAPSVCLTCRRCDS